MGISVLSRRRRVYERLSNWHNPSDTPTWQSATYTQSTASFPDPVHVGGHDLSTTIVGVNITTGLQQKKQTITYDAYVIDFVIPDHAVTSAKIAFYFQSQSYGDTIMASRITAAYPSAGYPSVTSTHRASAAIPKAGGAVEIDITNIINDAVTAGAWYGIWIDTPSIWTSRNNKTTPAQIELLDDIADDNLQAQVCINGDWHRVVSAQVSDAGTWHSVKALKKA